MQQLAESSPLLAADGSRLRLAAEASVEPDPHHILNNLGESGSRAVFELRTVPGQPSESYFVSSVSLGRHVALPLDALLRLACLAGPCVVPRLRRYRDNACFVPQTSSLCRRAELAAGSYSSLCSLHLDLSNLGQAPSPALQATLALPLGSQLFGLLRDPDVSADFEDLGANFELNIRKYRFGVSQLAPGSGVQFTALVACVAEEAAAAAVSLTGIDSVPRKLYVASSRPW